MEANTPVTGPLMILLKWRLELIWSPMYFFELLSKSHIWINEKNKNLLLNNEETKKLVISL